MTDLNSLVVFAKVVEANSFSEAARRLKMPISTVSRKIAELEVQLGLRLLERSTHSLRLTDLGAEILDFARHSAALNDAVEDIASNQLAVVSGTLRLSAPPCVSDTLIGPLVTAFQAIHPEVRANILVTDRIVDHIVEAVDLAFTLGEPKDSSLVSRRLLSYRELLVASPAYLTTRRTPENPQDLLDHRLLAFSHREPQTVWHFVHVNGDDTDTLTFQPHVSTNDFSGLVPTLLAGGGIGLLPPLVQPDLVGDGRLMKVMTAWRLPVMNLRMVHLGKLHIPRAVKLFKDFSAQLAPALFPNLPV